MNGSSIEFFHSFILPNFTDITSSGVIWGANLLITDSIISLNSTNLSFFNETATVTFSNTFIVDPYPIVDFASPVGGPYIFQNCSNFAGLCTNESFPLVGQNYSYTVAHFTTFSRNGTAAMRCPMRVNESINLTNDMISAGSCIAINSSNLTLDCKGHSILGSGVGTGINATMVLLPGPPFVRFPNNITIQNCHIDNFEHDILIQPTNGLGNNTILNNNLTNGTVDALFIDTSRQNIIINNYMHSTSFALRTSALGDTILHNNRLESTDTLINMLSDQKNNSFVNTTLTLSGTTWMRVDMSSKTAGNVTFTNTTFKTDDGHIQIISTATIPDGVITNVSTTQLDITLNNSFLNSTNQTWLNKSAQIKLDNLPFSAAPTAVVDLNDSGTYETCNISRCTVISYNGSTFLFNVSSFTSYAGRGQANPTPTPGGAVRGGGGSGSFMTIPYENPKEQKAESAPLRQKVEQDQKQQKTVKQSVEKPKDVTVTQQSLIPVIKKNAISAATVAFYALALLAITALALLLLKRKKTSTKRIYDRIEEVKKKMDKYK